MKLNQYRGKLKYVILILLAAFLLGNRGFRGLVRNALEYRRLEKQKLALELERKNLESSLRDSKDPERIERTARRELGLIRPKEIEYRFPPPKKGD